jgi:hypothetical protein
MRETQASLSEWKIATFGEYGKQIRTVVRAQEEWVEFMRSYSTDKPDPVEIADTALILYALADKWEVNLDTAGWQEGNRYRGFDIEALLARAGHCMATMTTMCLLGDPAPVSLIDMFHLLAGIARALDQDLCQLIDDKMVINRRRTWEVHEGHGYHIRSSEGEAA